MRHSIGVSTLILHHDASPEYLSRDTKCDCNARMHDLGNWALHQQECSVLNNEVIARLSVDIR